MEQITNIFKELKDRLSNPLISSFVIAWIVINWKVIIGLLFYKPEELFADGYKSYIDLILRHQNPSKFIWYPLLAAILFTFIHPVIKNCIYAFNAWTKTWGNIWILGISKPGVVPMTKFIEVRQSNIEKSRALEELMKNEGKYRNEISNLEIKTAELVRDKANLLDSYTIQVDQNEKWVKFNNVSFLNGEWDFAFTSNLGDGKSENKRFLIQNETVSEIYNSNKDKRRVYQIEYYSCNVQQKRISFCLFPMNDQESEIGSRPLFHSLRYSDDFKLLKGTERKSGEIVYRKINVD